MQTLRTMFGLTQGTLVIVKVRASNSIGYGDYSETNTFGAVIATEPLQMRAPYLGTNINLNQLEIFWYPLTGNNTGGSEIISYNLQYD